MPIPNEIASAALAFRQNSDLLTKSHAGLTDEEWLRRPGESSNHLLWITGHLIAVRGNLLRILGQHPAWSRPWLPLFARGAKLVDPSQYPSPEEIRLAWLDVSAALAAAFEQASPEALSAPPPDKLPSFDGTISGAISFLAYHETYHIGQAAYLRRWLGHDGVTG
jgi:uncharacterized damage-inducible protein DinB